MRNVNDIAADIAIKAHFGQVDKAGHPYITHPARVALNTLRLAKEAGYTEDEIDQALAVAWLHDVVEDTTVTLNDLGRQGMPPNVVTAVEAITHRENEPRAEYYARVKQNALALMVKRADILDNTAPHRVQALDDETRARLVKKYEDAKVALGIA